MCGITGIFGKHPDHQIDQDTLSAMTEAIKHRGPDQSAFFAEEGVGLGFRRLCIIDPENGRQPFYSEDGRVRLICNGEIYNYKPLRDHLRQKGYVFRTECDIEVLLPLYLEYGSEFLKKLNGQFALAIFDGRDRSLLLARDHFGICPLFYTDLDDCFLFASEIKSLLKHPGVEKEVDLRGLDQVLSFPGLVSPVTMFNGVFSLKPGSLLRVRNGKRHEASFWDLSYPLESYCYPEHPESYYIDKLEGLLLQSVRYRLNADVPVGFYLSGGLDSSLIGAMIKKIEPDSVFDSFSVTFPGRENRDIDESYYQEMVSRHIGSRHHEIPFDLRRLNEGMREMVYYSECPLKESYNSCSLALSNAVRQHGIKVVLSGEGSDEFFGGYVGYRFDVQRGETEAEYSLEDLLEQEANKNLWGDADFFYEKKYHEFSEIKKSIFSCGAVERHDLFSAYKSLELDRSKLAGRHRLHKRSYLDLKLRLSDHLIADHCDRTCYANSIEGRYPFLDIDVVNFVQEIPPHLKLNKLVEKYILKKIGDRYLPHQVCARQKQGFVAHGSPHLVRGNFEWVNDLLSSDRIKRQGYFDPLAVERMKKLYARPDFRLNLPFDSDLLITILTFNIFLEVFDMPDL